MTVPPLAPLDPGGAGVAIALVSDSRTILKAVVAMANSAAADLVGVHDDGGSRSAPCEDPSA